MTPQFKTMQEYQQDRNDQRRRQPDPETAQQTWGWLRASSALTQIEMLEKSHKNSSIVYPDDLFRFEWIINRVKQDLDEIMEMIRDSSMCGEINPVEDQKTGSKED